MSKDWESAFAAAGQTSAMIIFAILGSVPLLAMLILSVAGWFIDWPIGLIADIGVAITVLPLLVHRYLIDD